MKIFSDKKRTVYFVIYFLITTILFVINFLFLKDKIFIDNVYWSQLLFVLAFGLSGFCFAILFATRYDHTQVSSFDTHFSYIVRYPIFIISISVFSFTISKALTVGSGDLFFFIAPTIAFLLLSYVDSTMEAFHKGLLGLGIFMKKDDSA